MIAKRAYKILRQLVPFINVAAHLAHPALFALGLGLGLYVLLVVGVGHGLHMGDHPGLGYRADEHAVGVQVHILLHLQRHEGVDELGQKRQPIVRAQNLLARELVRRAAGLEAEVLENREGRVLGQTVDVHDPCLLDNVMGIVVLVDAHRNAVGGVGHLGHGVDNQAIVLFAVAAGDDVQAIANVKQGGQVVLVRGVVLPGQIVLAEVVGQGLQLFAALRV